MIRVLIINSSLERSGLTNVIYNLIKYIDFSKIELHILTLSEETTFSRYQEFTEFPIQFHCLPLAGFKRYLGLKKSVQPFIEKIEPHIIHTFAFRGVLAAYQLAGKYKVVSTIQADLDKNYIADYGFLVGKLMAKAELFMLRRMAVRTVCSLELMQLYKHIGTLNYIPNGVCTQDYDKVNNIDKAKYKETLQLNQYEKIFISTGILNERKNPLCIIRAFKKISNATNALIILGDGSLMEACKAEIGSDINIFLLGKKADVRMYLAASDVFISASWSEGLPNASLEAGFMGLSLVLSKILPHQEIASQSSAGVHLFKPGIVDDLVKVLQQDNMEAAQLNQQFSAQSMSRSFQELYASLA
jgi:glycosyltransferase involved in cell wall biosynthesis